MPSNVRISQPDGLSLILERTGSRGLDVTVEGSGLSGHASVSLNSAELCRLFRDVATGTAPKWGRWEYKSDEDFILHAAPSFPAGPDEICLWINLCSTEDDNTDWQVKGTIVLLAERFREYAAEVERAFGGQLKP